MYILVVSRSCIELSPPQVPQRIVKRFSCQREMVTTEICQESLCNGNNGEATRIRNSANETKAITQLESPTNPEMVLASENAYIIKNSSFIPNKTEDNNRAVTESIVGKGYSLVSTGETTPASNVTTLPEHKTSSSNTTVTPLAYSEKKDKTGNSSMFDLQNTLMLDILYKGKMQNGSLHNLLHNDRAGNNSMFDLPNKDSPRNESMHNRLLKNRTGKGSMPDLPSTSNRTKENRSHFMLILLAIVYIFLADCSCF